MGFDDTGSFEDTVFESFVENIFESGFGQDVLTGSTNTDRLGVLWFL